MLPTISNQIFFRPDSAMWNWTSVRVLESEYCVLLAEWTFARLRFEGGNTILGHGTAHKEEHLDLRVGRRTGIVRSRTLQPENNLLQRVHIGDLVE